MKPVDSQLNRLLRGAAAHHKVAATNPDAPRAAWLLAQADREREHEPVSAGAFAVLRGGLAAACLLLVLTIAVSLWQAYRARTQTPDVLQPVAVLARGVLSYEN